MNFAKLYAESIPLCGGYSISIRCEPLTIYSAHHIQTLSLEPHSNIANIMSEEPRKRSRFDQTEPTVDPRRSRSDRRSRSPATRDTEVKAAHSPVSGSVETTVGKERREAAAAAAAAAAARINASLKARQSAQPVDVPPIRSTLSPAVTSSTAKSPSAGGTGDQDIYQQDGDYIKDIEVNDLRNRYTLTKGSTQKLVNHHLLLPTDILRPMFPSRFLLVSSLRLFIFLCITTLEDKSRSLSDLPAFRPTKVSYADRSCVTFRSKKRLAPVRYTIQTFY